MTHLMENTVFSGLVIAWRLATWPTRISPSFVKATTDGVSRLPSWLGMTTGSPPSITATTEFVVPRSMPMVLAMLSSCRVHARERHLRMTVCDSRTATAVASDAELLQPAGDFGLRLRADDPIDFPPVAHDKQRRDASHVEPRRR